MECQPCCVCDGKITLDGEGPRDILCVQCRNKASDLEFVQRVLEGLPCVKPHCQNERGQAGQLRRRNGNAEYTCSLCDFSTREQPGQLALIAELVAAQGPSDARARLERYRRWQAVNVATLSNYDRDFLRPPPGVRMPGPSPARRKK